MSFDRIIDLLRQSATLNSAAPAILAEGRKTLSYGELLDQIDRTAKILIKAGVKATDRVAVIGTSGPEMAVLVLTVMAIACCAPLNPQYTATELEFYLRDIGPLLLLIEGVSFAAREVAQKLGISTFEVIPDGQSAGMFKFAEINKEVADTRFAAADDTALVLHTSGTTARPKMVPLTQRNLCNSAGNIARSLALSPNDRCLSVMPLFHIHGLIGAVLSTIASGGSLACAGMFRPPAFFGWLKEFRPTWFTATPSIHSAILERAGQLDDNSLPHRLRFIRSCSAPLSPRIIANLEDYFHAPVVEAYGMTEAAHQIASNPLPPRQRKPGSVGIATGTAIAIMDAKGALVPSGMEGEIVVRGENVTAGYIAAPEVNAAAFTNGWFRTGDQGRFDEDEYLYITGRIKEIINRGGEKISPREIDEVLLAHPAVAEAVAFSLPDARLGEDVGAAIVLKADAGGVDARALLNFAATRLAPFKLPRRIIFVSEIPKGPTGKPQRIGLAKRLGLEERTLAAASLAAPQPSTLTETTLLRLCQEIFALPTLGIEDNFFDSGGDSLSALTLLLEIERRWDVTVTIADMFAAPTVVQFAKIIDLAAGRERPPQMAIIQAGGSRPPFFCLGAGPRYRELARLLGLEQPFFGPVLPHPSDLPDSISIEDIAAYHVRNILDTQPHGPYFLGGWCIDGLVAYEVAQRLRMLGEPVGLLAMFDTHFYSSRYVVIYGHFRALAIRVVERVSSVIRGWQWSKIPGYLRRRLSGAGNRMQGLLDPSRSRQSAEKIGWMETEVQRRAAEAYRPLPYDERVLLLQRSKEQSRWTRARQDWSRLVRGRYEACDIPGNHLDMFEKVNVLFTAEKLRASLYDAQEALGVGDKVSKIESSL